MTRSAVAYIQSPAGRRAELIDRITSVRHHLVDMEMELAALDHEAMPTPVQAQAAPLGEWLSAREIADRLHVTPQCVAGLGLERRNVGRAVRYSVDSLQRYMAVITR